MVNPGTIAAMAASLMGQGENLSENAEIFQPGWAAQRRRRVSQFVALAIEISQETERQIGIKNVQPNRN